ncbi:MAG: sialidase family protein [Phycisphaerae bacterium]|nr:sialidase family protein [Tepidisphaeraceae bacterium]
MEIPRHSRRRVLKASVAVGLAPLVARGADEGESADLIASVEHVVVREGRKAGTSWFHPRPTLIPPTTAGGKSTVLMTIQSITGSDVFGPVHWSTSDDAAATWADPQVIPGLGRRKADAPDNAIAPHDPVAAGMDQGVCDVVPEYHAKTDTVLAIGHTVFYRNNKLATPQPFRQPVYTVRTRDGKWTEPKVLKWDDPRGALIYTCGCGQRSVMDDGDVLIPISFGPRGRADRSVATARCSFDGRELAIKGIGNELRNTKGRGLLEPSVVKSGGRFYMTIRAEDERGYVTSSDDGMQWAEPTAWAWDGGLPLTMSTTQQHWLSHADGLYLAYTRKDEKNAKQFRFRTPLYCARVDRKSLRLVKATERIVLPMRPGEGKLATAFGKYGNFHTCGVTATESIVMDGEAFPENGYRGDLLQARVKWNRPGAI